MSGAALKTYSINSEDGERGVTFRVGKFIGQVSIESVKFRRQHWLFLLICLLMFIIVLSIYLPIASRASSLEDPDYRMRVVSQLLRETPLIDGHNDLPWNIRQFVHNKIKTVNFSSDLSQVSPWASSKWSHTDIPRLVKGKVGAQVPRETFLIHGGSLPTTRSCGWPTPPVGPSTRTRCRSPSSRST
jgi:hypothetical protein